MSDTTYGFKVNSELKEKVSKMIEASGLQSKEWFEKLVTLFELQEHKDKDGMKKYISDITAIEGHSNRINEVFSSLLKKVVDEQRHHQRDVDDLNARHEEAKRSLNAQVFDLETTVRRLTEDLNSANGENKSLIKQLNGLEELSNTQKMMIEDQIVRIKQLEAQTQELTNGGLQELQESYRALEKEMELLKILHENEVLHLKATHAEQILSLLPKKQRKPMQDVQEPHKKKLGRPKKQTDQDANVSGVLTDSKPEEFVVETDTVRETNDFTLQELDIFELKVRVNQDGDNIQATVNDSKKEHENAE